LRVSPHSLLHSFPTRRSSDLRTKMFSKIRDALKDTVSGFMGDEALSRAAAIAYFTIFSIAPLLPVVIAIAGLVFGREAAQAAIIDRKSTRLNSSHSQISYAVF